MRNFFYNKRVFPFEILFLKSSLKKNATKCSYLIKNEFNVYVVSFISLVLILD